MKISPDMREMIDRAVNAGRVTVIPPGVATGVQSAPIQKKRGRPRVVPMDETATEKRERRARAAAESLRDRRRFKVTPIATGKPLKTAPADATGTMYPSRVFDPMPTEGVLKDGCSNSKIGGDVLKGHLKGARIFTLTLEERATCPKSCDHWTTCVVPGSRVLKSDLQWVPIETLEVGDRIAAFEEYASAGQRMTRIAEVEKLGRAVEPCFRVVTARGIVTASAKHKWLVQRGARTDFRWRTTDQLRLGDRLQFFGEPWETDTSYDAGRLRGFVEGEGSCGVYGNNGFAKSRIGWSQRPTKLCDEIIEVAHRLGFKTARGERIAGVRQTAVSHIDIPGGWREVARFLGRIRPTRMIEKAEEIWVNHAVGGRGGRSAEVLAVEPVGSREVVTIQTSTRTMVAEGFFTHNCYGNGMPHPRRWKHGPELEEAIEREVKALCATFPKVLVRLHVLGDFYSFQYLILWVRLLDEHPGLNVFGFTAWQPGTVIGDGIGRVRKELGARFAIRHSGRTGEWGSFTVDGATERRRFGDAIVCPEQVEAERQTGRHCGNCALCWHSSLPIVFREH